MATPIETTGSNPGNIPFSGPKDPMTESEINKKINESEAGESGDDISSEKYKNQAEQEKDNGPNFDKDSDQEDGDTSVNAGVFK